MKRILFLIVVVMSATFNGSAQQNKMKIDDIKEIWVYDYFSPRGYTTAGIAHKFHDLEYDNIMKFKLDSIFVDSLKNMLYSTTTRKVFQEKTGQNLIFAQFVMKNNSVRNIIICSVGIVDYFVGYTAYFFKNDTSSENKTLWVKNFYGTLMNKINPK
jgi:hypothetical protein